MSIDGVKLVNERNTTTLVEMVHDLERKLGEEVAAREQLGREVQTLRSMIGTIQGMFAYAVPRGTGPTVVDDVDQH